MRASSATAASRDRRRSVVAFAIVAIAMGGCQAILGIDPDARHEAAASSGNDDAASDVTSDTSTDARVDEAGSIDSAVECHDAGDCASLARSACEKGICAAGHCELVSRDGEKCVSDDGTCRGYACISSDLVFGTSGDTTCIRAVDGLVWCWGNDATGQLGDGLTAARSTPYLVPRIGDDLAGASTISVGPDHACAVLTDTTVVCWGANSFGQSTGEDAGGATAPIDPTEVHEAPQSTAVAAGLGSTCVLTGVGNVWCWGDNSSGQLGLGSSAASVVSRPNRIDLLAGIGMLSGAVKTVCAAPNNGLNMVCWGDNTWGQLGDRCAGNFCAFPTLIDGVGEDSGVVQGIGSVVTSWGNVCVTVGPLDFAQCWGNDRAGQLGNGRGVDFFGDGGSGDQPSSLPGLVLNPDGGDTPSNEFAILGAGTHFCAHEYPARGYDCWGENSNGELGAKIGFYPQPFQATVFDRAHAVTLGDQHACMLRAEPDSYFVSCLGRAQAGQMGDGLPIADRQQTTPVFVKFPATPGGVAALRARQ